MWSFPGQGFSTKTFFNSNVSPYREEETAEEKYRKKVISVNSRHELFHLNLPCLLCFISGYESCNWVSGYLSHYLVSLLPISQLSLLHFIHTYSHKSFNLTSCQVAPFLSLGFVCLLSSPRLPKANCISVCILSFLGCSYCRTLSLN